MKQAAAPAAKIMLAFDRDRHRDHTAKARQAFPAAGRGITTRIAPARISAAAPSPPEPGT